MNSKIKNILDEMILSLEELSDEKIILKKRYREYYENAIKENNDLEDKDFYFSLIYMTEDYINIEDFKPNDMMTYLYEKNLHSINELERYALKLYKLYTDETHEKINYLEDIKSKRSEQIQEAT